MYKKGWNIDYTEKHKKVAMVIMRGRKNDGQFSQELIFTEF